MIKNFRKFTFILILFCLKINLVSSEVITKIEIVGNERISNETIIMFSDIKTGDDLKNSDLNIILKNLYDSNFFNNVSVGLTNNLLSISVEEAPLIQNITLTGIKAKKFEDLIIENRILKPKSSFNEFLLSEEINLIKSQFKQLGFYFAEVEAKIKELDNNLVDIEYKINMGEKSKIAKISFIGDKIYKNRKLQSIIVSEEYRFWKFISGKKYLQEQLINLDKRLLKNFYLNNGFYNVKINSSFAKLIGNNEFELIFNIDSGDKIFFGELNIVLPNDFDKSNYENLDKLFKNLENNPYSINAVDKILEEIDKITIQEEFKTINASINEVINDNKLNINFIIEESDKFFVERINIYGNNITRESVIRNQLELDEGDPFSDLLVKKSENNIKSLNFFKKVKTNIIDGKDESSKILNFEIEEKPTGEIMAGAGAGTEGGTFYFGIKENNYLGKGVAVDANATFSAEAFKGSLNISNPNYNNSDKRVFFNLQAIEIDQLKNYGYKTNKNGFEIGTSFEYLEDLNIGLSTSSFVEKIETDATASSRQKKQAGNYLDLFLNLDLNLDRRNQKFKTSEGYFSNYDVKLPLISDTHTLTNSYNYKIFSELFENNISSFSILLRGATSLTNDDIKLTERLSIPSRKLRGFESGKVGPKDGADFIGGNYLVSLNLQSNMPFFFQNSQNLDAVIFFDAANVWGVDYDSSIDDGSKIRSSIGVGIDWLTPVGPLNFSLSEVISKKDTDIEESFRFNLGTTF
jgi:outer membrane protein insertion porin family